jgi:hypothetical protein
VTWQDLAVSRKAVPGDASIPSLLTPFTKLLRQQQRTTLTAVQPTSGVLRPGRQGGQCKLPVKLLCVAFIVLLVAVRKAIWGSRGNR